MDSAAASSLPSSSAFDNNGNSDGTKLQNLNTLGSILLGIFIIVSFVANMFLLSTIASSYQLRHVIFNYFLINITVVNLIDTAINLVLSMLYVSTGQWQLGRGACLFNSFFEQLVLIETLAAVVLMTVDRAVALASMARYDGRMTAVRCGALIAGAWIVGGVVSVPILAGNSIVSEPNRYRYFCCNYAQNPMGYPVCVLTICFAFPLLVVLLSIGAVLLRAHEERLRRRAMLPERLADYTDFIVDNRRVQKQMQSANYAVVVFVVYAVLQGPYVAFNFFGQIRNSRELNSLYDGQMSMSGDAETAITWLKTLFPVCFPFLTFCFCKDIWRKFQDLVCCRKTNVITTQQAAFHSSSGLDAVDNAGVMSAGGGNHYYYHSGGSNAGNGGGGGGGNNKDQALNNNNVVTIVPTSAGIHQIRPGNDRCEYADVLPQIGNNGNNGGRRRRSDDKNNGQYHGGRRRSANGGCTSDYDSADDEDGDGDEDAGKNVAARIYRTELIDGSIQKTTFEISSAPSINNNVISAQIHPVVVAEPDPNNKQNQELDHPRQQQHQQELSLSSAIQDDWPAFRPKSTASATSNDRGASPPKNSLGHLNTTNNNNNPGSVPSPAKWTRRNMQKMTEKSADQEIDRPTAIPLKDDQKIDAAPIKDANLEPCSSADGKRERIQPLDVAEHVDDLGGPMFGKNDQIRIKPPVRESTFTRLPKVNNGAIHEEITDHSKIDEKSIDQIENRLPKIDTVKFPQPQQIIGKKNTNRVFESRISTTTNETNLTIGTAASGSDRQSVNSSKITIDESSSNARAVRRLPNLPITT